MKFSKKATSIAEALIVTVIISIGLVGVYNIYNQSNKLSSGVKNKIAAIQIAREGIEAFTNIRDTNWLIFSKLNYEKCWNTLNYNNSCITSTNLDYIIKENSPYKIYRSQNNRWTLETKSTFSGTGYLDQDYRDYYKIILDKKGLYSQTGSIGTNGNTKLNPIYTREIIIEYLDNPPINKNYQELKVISKVNWSDNTKKGIREVKIETVLTNWKYKKN